MVVRPLGLLGQPALTAGTFLSTLLAQAHAESTQQVVGRDLRSGPLWGGIYGALTFLRTGGDIQA